LLVLLLDQKLVSKHRQLTLTKELILDVIDTAPSGRHKPVI